MVTKEELFVSLSPEIYRENKSNILLSQTDVLTILKKLYNLKVLARQKQDLKKRLYKLFILVSNDIDSIQDKMPTPKVPKSVQKEDEPKSKSKESFLKYDDIEYELRLIREKLMQLNTQ